jgi:hypothetical protein
LDRRLGGPQSQSAYGVEKKSPVIASAENWTPAIQPVA